MILVSSSALIKREKPSLADGSAEQEEDPKLLSPALRRTASSSLNSAIPFFPLPPPCARLAHAQRRPSVRAHFRQRRDPPALGRVAEEHQGGVEQVHGVGLGGGDRGGEGGGVPAAREEREETTDGEQRGRSRGCSRGGWWWCWGGRKGEGEKEVVRGTAERGRSSREAEEEGGGGIGRTRRLLKQKRIELQATTHDRLLAFAPFLRTRSS